MFKYRKSGLLMAGVMVSISYLYLIWYTIFNIFISKIVFHWWFILCFSHYHSLARMWDLIGMTLQQCQRYSAPCDSGKNCYRYDHSCNSIQDCEDNSDEANCRTLSVFSVKRKVHIKLWQHQWQLLFLNIFFYLHPIV